MTAEIDISIGYGEARGIPVPATSTDVVLITGEACLYGWTFREASGGAQGAAEGSAAAPAAGTVIATFTVAVSGTYTVSWEVELAGPVAAADSNNFGLYKNAVLQLQSVNPAVVGTYIQPPVQIQAVAGDVIAIKAVGAATAGTTYSASESLSITQAVAASAELQDGGQALAEVACEVGGADREWFGSPGLHVSGQIKLHMVSGVLTGVVYVGFDRSTG